MASQINPVTQKQLENRAVTKLLKINGQKNIHPSVPNSKGRS
jgi:hypothetical protein